MGILLIYEIQQKNQHHLTYAMLELGYTRHLLSHENGRYRPSSLELPTGTLFHPTHSSKQAVDELVEVCQILGVFLKKAIAIKVESSTTVFNHNGFDPQDWLANLLPKDDED